MYNVISSGSKGNAVLYCGHILVDCGVSFTKIDSFLKQINIVLLTHSHKDHLNIRTLKRLQNERPSVRIATPEWLVPELPELKNVDVIKMMHLYDYGSFRIAAVKAYHDVLNCGWRIFENDKKIFHITDTAHLEGITAKGYDLYAIEHNYDENKVQKAKEESQRNGEFTHAFGSEQTHLSWQQARAFIEANKKSDSEILELHKSSTFY